MRISRCRRWMAGGLAFAVSLAGCPTEERQAPAPTEVTAPEPPLFELASAATTFTAENPHRQVQLEVTVSNPGTTDRPVDWSQLVARGGCLGPTPGWSMSGRPGAIQPGQSLTARAIWSCQPPFDASKATPTSLTVAYYHRGTQAFRREVPVRVLGTTGLVASFGPPVSARPFQEPHPARGGGWDVCVRGIARNGSEEPVMLVPRFRASVVEPAEPGGVGIGWLGQNARPLAPGETVSGRVCFRLYGEGDPRPRRLRIEPVAFPGPPCEIEVPPGP